jgi:hypothetical protein
MGDKATSFKRGTGAVQFHPVPYLFWKQPPRNNILIGDDAAQIRFVEQLTDCTCETVESVSDDDLLGKDGVLYRLLTSSGLDLSAQLRAKTGIWSLAPVTPGSAGANALVRAAANILKEPLKKERLDSLSKHIGRTFERNDIVDLRAGLWETVWVMTGELLPHRWREPWETVSIQEWAPPGVDLGLRLGAFFKTIRAYVVIHNGAENDAKKMGVPPHRIMQLKELRLSPEKVYESLKVLSRWKNLDTDPRVVILALTKVWLS